MNAPELPQGGGWRRLPRAWFYLTPNERFSIAIILGLFLLGLGARWWHLSHARSESVNPPVAESNMLPVGGAR